MLTSTITQLLIFSVRTAIETCYLDERRQNAESIWRRHCILKLLVLLTVPVN